VGKEHIGLKFEQKVAVCKSCLNSGLDSGFYTISVGLAFYNFAQTKEVATNHLSVSIVV